MGKNLKQKFVWILMIVVLPSFWNACGNVNFEAQSGSNFKNCALTGADLSNCFNTQPGVLKEMRQSVNVAAQSEVDIQGRGTGKSYVIGWEINEIVRRMPRSITLITGRTYGQIYTRTLPSTIKFLEKIGYEKDKDFKIGGKPPETFLSPYEPVTKFDNYISFANGTGFLMLSQERAGSSRVYGVKTFEHPFDRLEDSCHDVLNLVPEFDKRFVRWLMQCSSPRVVSPICCKIPML